MITSHPRETCVCARARPFLPHPRSSPCCCLRCRPRTAWTLTTLRSWASRSTTATASHCTCARTCPSRS
eukprot:12625336-Alexandrium_andersonii.AAC.1